MKSYAELEFCLYDPKFIKFYRCNSNRENNIDYIYKLARTDKNLVREFLDSRNPELDFVVTQRTVENGVHIDDISLDRLWNLGLNINTDIFNVNINGKNLYKTPCGFIFFKTKEEKDNFTDFWYRNGKNGLMNKFIKGLNKTDGTIELAIPRVDWTRSWTDEEILAEFGYTEEEINEIL